jgi:ataxia telangiectasia mutated family protein
MSYEIRMDTLLTASSSSQPRMETGSRRAILGCLWKVLLGDIRRDVSLSQKTLQIIVTKALGTDLWSECEETFPRSLLNALTWSPLSFPSLSTTRNEVITLQKAVIICDELPFATWIRQLCVALLAMLPNDIILSELEPILSRVDKVVEDLFPAILHLVLLGEFDTHQKTKQIFSAAISQIFNDFTESRTAHTRLILHSIIYLRYQALPHEHTKADRYRWLDFDYEQASAVAVKCRMFKTALLLLETGLSEANKSKRSRRSSGLKVTLPTELLLTIYRNLDDKDSFYGIRQPSSLSTMMEQLEYENAGFKSLSFRGAHFDGQIRLLSEHTLNPEREMVKVLDNLDLNGLSQAVLSSMNGTDPMSTEAMFRTARKLERWDLSSSGAQESASSTIFTAFQEISRASDHKSIKAALDKGFSAAMTSTLAAQAADVSLHSALACLAVLSEVEDVVSSQGLEQLMEVWERLEAHNEWMLTER